MCHGCGRYTRICTWRGLEERRIELQNKFDFQDCQVCGRDSDQIGKAGDEPTAIIPVILVPNISDDHSESDISGVK